MKVLTEQRIRSSIQKFYSSIKNDENARYKSWEYCYKIFGEKQNKTDPETIDLLCLHLGFYLAVGDRYVKYTLKEYNIGHPSFCSSRLKELNEFYLKWKSVIDDENQKINSNGIKVFF